ncbi:type II toxin-antitoxin system Phd/YefM family antitoxin [Phytohabitans houttuyneae]|uniref:Uncharacterized protein n=1 Tax=Phytohabitans houttuyneae TaxID=1076126 RepID=A0A6V8KRE7_9ACTN|nr:hypothetical protein [Phytohabitans houttuyneae]GFJ84921.1 hypothetical protein Phou_091010 [Phytohabitans houttuyneae]
MEGAATWALAGSTALLAVSLIAISWQIFFSFKTLDGSRTETRAEVLLALRTLARARVGATITGKADDGDSGAVLLVLEEDYAGLEETAYLLSDTANAAHLLRSIEQLELGEGKVRDLIEE